MIKHRHCGDIAVPEERGNAIIMRQCPPCQSPNGIAKPTQSLMIIMATSKAEPKIIAGMHKTRSYGANNQPRWLLQSMRHHRNRTPYEYQKLSHQRACQIRSNGRSGNISQPASEHTCKNGMKNGSQSCAISPARACGIMRRRR